MQTNWRIINVIQNTVCSLVQVDKESSGYAALQQIANFVARWEMKGFMVGVSCRVSEVVWVFY